MQKTLNKGEPLVEEEIDQANGVLYPFYDASNNVVFTAGKVIKNIYLGVEFANKIISLLIKRFLRYPTNTFYGLPNFM